MKLLSAKFSNNSINLALLILRLVSGGLMVNHGYKKLTGFSEMQSKFMDFLGLGQSVSLGLTVFAEFFCALLIIFGLFTRFAALILIITMAVALFMAHSGEVWGEGEMAALYLGIFISLFIAGPGAYSLDGALIKK